MQNSKTLTDVRKKIESKFKYRNLLRFQLSDPELKFVIYTRGRTGSTLLTELLNCHPEVYCDVEIFNFLYSKSRVMFPELYIDSSCKRATLFGRRVYGFKVKIAQLRYEHKYSSYDKILQNLYEDDWKFIYLKRTNLLRHKISNIYSSQTNVFHVKDSEQTQLERINVNCYDLLEGIKYGEEVYKTEKENLKHIPHLEVTYEKDLLDNSKQQQTCDRIFDFLGVKRHPVFSQSRKLIPYRLEEVISNYDEVYNFFKNTEYFKYLIIP